MKTKWTSAIFFGINKETEEIINLSAPSWDCDWYWGFGYLGNRDLHYHLSGYQSKDHFFTLKDDSYKSITEQRNKNMYDCLNEDYNLNPKIKDNLWSFCELVATAHILTETAEILGRGGSHYTKNICAGVIMNKDEVKRINEIVLPAIFDAIYKIIS